MNRRRLVLKETAAKVAASWKLGVDSALVGLRYAQLKDQQIWKYKRFMNCVALVFPDLLVLLTAAGGRRPAS